MQTNPWRGEVALPLNGITCVLRPTFAALCRIEQECDTGLITLAKKISSGAVTLGELSVIIRQCMVSPMPPGGIETSLAEGGLAEGMKAVSTMLAFVFGGFND